MAGSRSARALFCGRASDGGAARVPAANPALHGGIAAGGDCSLVSPSGASRGQAGAVSVGSALRGVQTQGLVVSRCLCSFVHVIPMLTFFFFLFPQVGTLGGRPQGLHDPRRRRLWLPSETRHAGAPRSLSHRPDDRGAFGGETF